MTDVLGYLTEYGAAVVFVVVLLEQVGLPLPSAVVLVGAGALAAQGMVSLPLVAALAVLAALLPNYVWYRVGWSQGRRVLGLLCRISLDPDACVRLTEHMVARMGTAALLIAKFLPGLNTLAPALVGVFRVPVRRFLLFNMLGIVVWVGTMLGLGHAFSGQLESAMTLLADWGLTVGVVVGGLLALWAGLKLLQRLLLIQGRRVARITVDEVQRRLEAGEPLLIVDLRHPWDRERLPVGLPGAVPLAPSELRRRRAHLPPDREWVLYCS